VSRYFDYNATAPLRPEVREAVIEALGEDYGNPSSMHARGRAARRLIDQARARVAALVGADPRSVVFTSGATESNNLALRGFASRHPGAAIVTTSIEHASVLRACDALEHAGTPVARLPVDAGGQPDTERLAALGDDRPRLFSLGWANGETGHVVDLERVLGAVDDGVVVHVDAAQAAGRIPIEIGDRVDLMSLSAHKMGGPRGVGALVVRDAGDARDGDELLAAQLSGGPQEDGLRAGTENLAGIAGRGVAAELARAELDAQPLRLRTLRERLWTELDRGVEDLLRLTPSDGLPNTLTVATGGLDADVIVAALDLEGFAVSTGSACAAASPEPSHVIAALGVGERYRRGVVRMSMGHATRDDDVGALVTAFARVVGKARMAA
jgi:cysteine desulfurase